MPCWTSKPPETRDTITAVVVELDCNNTVAMIPIITAAKGLVSLPNNDPAVQPPTTWKAVPSKSKPKRKKYKPPAWLLRERREADRKYNTDREGALLWIKYYERRGKRIQTDPLLTFQHLGPPPEDEKAPPPIQAPNGELLTLSDLDASYASFSTEGEDGLGGEEEGEGMGPCTYKDGSIDDRAVAKKCCRLRRRRTGEAAQRTGEAWG